MSIFNQLTGQSSSKEIEGGVIKVRGKTLIFADTIFQIPNISAVSVIELRKPFPYLSLLLVLAGWSGFIQFSIGDISFLGTVIEASILIGIGIILIIGFWIGLWYMEGKRPGLQIITNAGAFGSILIIDTNKDFLKQVALTLRNIMDNPDERVVANFSIDSRQISIEGVSESVMAVESNVSGDIVNSIL